MLVWITTDLSASFNNETVIDIKLREGNNTSVLKGYALTSAQNVYYFVLNANGGMKATFTKNKVQSIYNDPFFKNKIFYAKKTNGNYDKLKFNGDEVVLNLPAPRGNAFLIKDNRLVSIGSKNNASRTLDAFFAAEKFNYQFTSLPIKDIFYSNVENRIIMSGENGLMNIGVLNQNNPNNSNNKWNQLETATVSDINSLEEINGDLFTAGSEGYFNRGTIDAAEKEYLNTEVLTVNGQSVCSTIESDLNQIHTDGDRIYVVGNNGKVIYAPSLNAPFNCLSHGSSDLKGVAFKPGTNKFIAVGSNNTIHSNTGVSYIAQKNIFLPEIIDFDFDNQTSGVFIAKGNNLRTTNTGGSTWNIAQLDATTGDYSEVEQYSNSKSYVFGTSSPKEINNGVVSKLLVTGLTDVKDAEKLGTSLFILNGSSLYEYSTLTNTQTQIATVGGNPKALSVSALAQIAVVGDNGLFKLYNTDGTLVLTTAPSDLDNANLNDVIFSSSSSLVAVGDNGAYFKTIGSETNNKGILDIVWEAKNGVYDNAFDPVSDLSAQNQINIYSVAFTSTVDGIYGGEYVQGNYPSYNNPESAFVRNVYNPDGKYSSRFFYDKLGRLVVSQNARQYNTNNRKYSYTLYDFLGRVIEVGEKSENGDIENSFENIFGTSVSDYYNPSVIDDQMLLAWVFGDGERQEVTKSYYDKTVINGLPSNFTPDVLTQRKRITHVTYEELYDGNDQTYDHGTHYNYDIHGNVTTLLQDNKKMSEEFASLKDMRFKKMEYTFDLVSGNVHRMSIQDGDRDQWHHAYRYDADNRITHVFTNDRAPILSNTSLPQALENELIENDDWEQEARYHYYDHGPLSRTELGDEQLQGCDYVYNLQGWLKGVNATSLEAGVDPGKDGVSGSINGSFSKDVMSFALNYFEDDYKAISSASQDHIADISLSSLAYTEAEDLYNGNIRNMHTTLTHPETREVMPMVNAYKYDQLNRLVESQSFESGFEDNKWDPTTYNNEYFNKFEYDAMGNILTQQRYTREGLSIEDLSYQYNRNDNDDLIQNRLYHVNDVVSDNIDETDIDDMGTFSSGTLININNNYSYDEEGRLIKDVQEEIEEIIWRVDGKVKEIKRISGSDKKNVSFDYDAMGNRIAKHITNNQTNLLEKSTYYILDAQGNTLNTYDHEVTDNAVLYTLKERQIYGSSRLGIYDDSISMYIPNPDDYVNKEKGHKFYELSNHLGNVLTVISDKKIPQMVTVKTLDFETPITESFDYADVCVPDKLFYEAAQFSGHTYEVDANGNTVYKIDGSPHSVQYSLDGLTPGESYTIAGRFIENNASVAVEVRSCENSAVITNSSFTSSGDFAVSFIAPYDNVRIKFLSLGGVWSADDISFSGEGLGSNEICYLADIVNIADYSPFGVLLDGRTVSSFMVDTEADCIVDTTYVLDTLTESYLHFDGVDDFVDATITNRNITDQITFEAWIRTSSVESFIPDVIASNYSGRGVQLLIRDGKASMEGRTADDGTYKMVTSSELVNDGVWHYLTGVVDENDNWYIYVDGVLSNQISYPNPTPIFTNLNTFYIGRTKPSSIYLFEGDIREVAVWNKAKNSVEIQSDYTNGVNTSAVNLVGYFAFDEGKGTVVTDASSTNINGTVIGASWMVEELYDTLDFVIDTICPTYRKKKYRYGFNGMEKDDEVKGEGNSYATEFRQYDARIGRWLSLDPLMAKFPWQSPYAAFDNNPILYNDPRGLAAQKRDPVRHSARQDRRFQRLENRLANRYGEGTDRFKFELARKGSKKRYGSRKGENAYGIFNEKGGDKSSATGINFDLEVGNNKKGQSENARIFFPVAIADESSRNADNEGETVGEEVEIKLNDVNDGDEIFIEARTTGGLVTEVYVEDELMVTFSSPLQDPSTPDASHGRSTQLKSFVISTKSDKPKQIVITVKAVLTKNGAVVHHTNGYIVPYRASKVKVAKSNNQ